jgi:hypothetical protein
MTNLAELAGMKIQAPVSHEVDLLLDGPVGDTAAAMTDMGDLYRYTGTKPNHKHATIPD